MTSPTFEPMGIGRLFNVAFSLYRRHFLRFFLIILIIQVPFNLLNILFFQGFLQSVSAGEGEASGGLYLSAILLTGFFSGIAALLMQGALTRALSEAYLGKDVSVGGSYQAVLPRLLTLLGVSILVGLLVALGLLLLIVPGVIFMLWYELTTPVVVVERQSALKAMGRSKSLVSGNLGKVFAVLVLSFLLTWVIGMVFGWIGSVVAAPMHMGSQQPSTAGMVISSAINILGQALVAPVTAGAVVLLYYDLRIRKEGFDLEMMADSLGLDSPEGAGAAATAANASSADDTFASFEDLGPQTLELLDDKDQRFGSTS